MKMIKCLLVLIALMIISDIRMIDGKLVGVTNNTVVYEDSQGHLWETYRDKEETYRLDSEVSILLRRNFTSKIEDDIIMKVEEK